MVRRSLRYVVVLALVALVAASCGKKETTAGGGAQGADCTNAANKVKIGVITPSSTDLSALALGIVNSAKLAADQANKACKIKSFQIVIDAQDDQKKPDVGAQVASKLASDPDVIGVVGTLNSSVAQTAVTPLDAAGIAMVSPANTNPSLTQGDNFETAKKRPHPNYFRVVTTDAIQGPFAAGYVYDKLGKKNAAIVHDNKTYGKGLALAFQKEFEKKGGKTTILTTINPDPGNTDFRSVVGAVKASNPDIVFYGGEYPQAGPFRAQMKELGLNVPLIGGDGINSGEFAKLGGQDGDFATNPGASPEKLSSAKKFLDDYKAAGYKEPFEAYGPFSYDATNIIIESAAGALSGKTKVDAGVRKAVIDNIQKINYNGATGATKFDQYGDTSNTLITVYKQTAGKFADEFAGTFQG